MKALLLLIAMASMPPLRAQPQDMERVGVRLIAVRTEADAMDVSARLKAGEQFAELARSRSIDPSARAGGYIGTMALRDLRTEFQDALNGVSFGSVSRIARVGQTYFLLQLSADEEG